ncbi:MAG: hypothetical protein BIFFINMI_02503 [Phycisphaerae bacterium]|nr:hypothetical protein [Phycisphaerae bacterium]
MGKKDFEFVEIPDRLRPLLGEVDPGTRLFRRFGNDDDYQEWWDAVCEICGEESSLSPGGVSMYAAVSRAGVHKRMKEGRITAFMFHVVKGQSRWTRRELLENSVPYIYIPGIEVRRWAEILGAMNRAEAKREAFGDGDFVGRFLESRGRKLPKGSKSKEKK